MAVLRHDFKNRAAEINGIQPLAAKQRQRQNIGGVEHRRFIGQYPAAHKHKCVLAFRVKAELCGQLRHGSLPRDHQVIAVGHAAN